MHWQYDWMIIRQEFFSESKGDAMSDRALEAIKGAILLEKRGQVLYGSIASGSDNAAVAEIFQKMAEEEKKHEQVLAKHYSSLVSTGELAAITTLGQVEDHTDQMLSDAVAAEITAAGYEAAAISAAMALEKQAVEYYSRCREEAATVLERDLYIFAGFRTIAKNSLFL